MVGAMPKKRLTHRQEWRDSRVAFGGYDTVVQERCGVITKRQRIASIFDVCLRTRPIGLIAGTVLFVALAIAYPAQAQTFRVLHTFTGADGGNPAAGLTIDRGGNLYGTTENGGNYNCAPNSGCGTVFKLSLRGSNWLFSELYDFAGGNDEGFPEARVIFGPDGSLYGTNGAPGSDGFDGTVFNLRPPATFCRSVSCPWTETVLFKFDFGTGRIPLGDLAFDAAGNIYGTTSYGGLFQNCGGSGCGVVYKLTQSDGSWTENILLNFTDGSDGGKPSGGVILDRAGNLYGTAPTDLHDGNSSGLVFELTPSGGTWTENVLYYFQGAEDGAYPHAGLISDSEGNLYGATTNAGSGDAGTVFQLANSGSGWNFSTPYGLPSGLEEIGPSQALVMDSAGNLYGAKNTETGGGSIFKLTPSNGAWTYTDLHDFTGGSDGARPNGNLVLDANGNIFGTTSNGGYYQSGTECQQGCGVVFEITP
jgi:uncharacterized repeat protein (TIGR03803 family)